MTRSPPPAGKRFGSKLRSQSARHRMRWQYIRSSRPSSDISVGNKNKYPWRALPGGISLAWSVWNPALSKEGGQKSEDNDHRTFHRSPDRHGSRSACPGRINQNAGQTPQNAPSRRHEQGTAANPVHPAANGRAGKAHAYKWVLMAPNFDGSVLRVRTSPVRPGQAQRAMPSDTGRTAPAWGARLPRIGVLKALNVTASGNSIRTARGRTWGQAGAKWDLLNRQRLRLSTSPLPAPRPIHLRAQRGPSDLPKAR
jgi:hypothetical protein